MPTITRFEDRQTGAVSYTIDDGGPQLLGQRFETRDAAEAALAASKPAKTRTITLTDRPPVKITEDAWPIIACAILRPGSAGTPKPDYETDEWSLRVRQHADGRAIVYGVVDAATAWTGTASWRGGELVDAFAPGTNMLAIAAAIRRVGTKGEMPESLIDDCIADLPPEEL